MQIVYFNPIGEIGGAERVLLLLLAESVRSDDTLQRRLLLGSDGPLRIEAEKLGIATEVLPLPSIVLKFGDSQLSAGQAAGGTFRTVRLLLRSLLGLPGALAYVFRLRRRLKQLAPDVIHSNGIKTHLLAALARPKHSKLIWHLHDFIGDRALVGSLMRRLAGRASLAVANSESVREDAAAILAPLPVRTIYNGIDVARFAPGPGNPAALDEAAGWRDVPAGAIRVGLVATYARWKGHDLFLQAAAAVVREAPQLPVYFYIIGGPIYRTAGSQYSLEELRKLAADVGLVDSGPSARVGFVPFQADAVAIYRALDIVVHASTRREPFGLTIVEAMSCGRAVVVSAAGGAAEILEPGSNGLGFTPGDVAELASAIRTLALDPALRERLGRGGRNTASERFSAERMATRFAELYVECKEVIKGGSAGFAR